MSTQNQAAWIKEINRPMEVAPSAQLEPNPDEVLIEVHAVAINPIDWIIQQGTFGTTAPLIVGEDVAGIITNIGEDVSDQKIGDRVVAYCDSFGKWDGRKSAFQKFCIARSICTFKIPEATKFSDAVVLPLTLFTAAIGLYKSEYLGLEMPNISTNKKENQILLVWGAGSAVGHNAIQLAISSGYEVIVTCSPKSSETVTSLGASKWFDYHDDNVVNQIVECLKGKGLVGVLNCVRFVDQPAEVIRRCELVSGKKCIAQAARYTGPEDLGDGVTQKFLIFKDMSEIYSGLTKDYLPNAIANGTYKLSPKAEVFGKGLESIQKAIDFQKVSYTFSPDKGLIYDEKAKAETKENTKLVVITKDEE